MLLLVKIRLLFEIRKIILYNKVVKEYKIMSKTIRLSLDDMADEFEMEEIRNNIDLKERSRDAANREGRFVD